MPKRRKGQPESNNRFLAVLCITLVRRFSQPSRFTQFRARHNAHCRWRPMTEQRQYGREQIKRESTVKRLSRRRMSVQHKALKRSLPRGLIPFSNVCLTGLAGRDRVAMARLFHSLTGRRKAHIAHSEPKKALTDCFIRPGSSTNNVKGSRFRKNQISMTSSPRHFS